jgi:hypothetical protein
MNTANAKAQDAAEKANIKFEDENANLNAELDAATESYQVETENLTNYRAEL